ncbi:SPOR domain-containing protein [Caenibius tardaugens]|nr:SPOR domain-containing protein [Caenibius tardaugens]AZI36707.1 sporulation protein [Caenibius tardaugens NBRC 16725]
MVITQRVTRFALLAALLAGTPALADVRDGVEAWSRGDYAKAVAQWEKEAARGNADAQYNLGQAYRLGRGVGQDMAKAQQLYATAAAAGHPLAADNYGLLLFQQGQRTQAMPYISAAADRGDPRAQYLLGIAHFNGDLMAKDWVRAYALVTLANGQNLPQATHAIAEMDRFIPLEQRQEGAALAVSMQTQADALRAQQLASVDLQSAGTGKPVPAAAPDRPVQSAAVVVTPPVPTPTPAATAVAAAAQVSGTESPAVAGADYARPQVAVAAPVAVEPPQVVTPPAPAANPALVQPAPKPAVKTAAPKPAAQKPATLSADGPWRLQLGAFAVSGNADQLWKKIGGRGVLAGKKKYLLPSGNLTRLLAGGYATRGDADTACAALKRSGQTCLVTR